jgi:hypothetical protein
MEQLHYRHHGREFPPNADAVTENDIDFLTHEIVQPPHSRGLHGRIDFRSTDHTYGFSHYQMQRDRIIEQTTLLTQNLRQDRTSAIFRQKTVPNLSYQDRTRRRQRRLRSNIEAILDTGAQVSTISERLAMESPLTRNLRDAPHGTAVMYGDGKLQPIDKIVDIGSYDFQLTPEHCAATLVSVHQIVKAGHEVTFSDARTTVQDVNQNYTLHYPRDPNSREWTIPIEAMAEISSFRAEHPIDNASVEEH